MSLTDPDVDARIDRVLTQYRESPKLLHVIRTYLSQLVEIRDAIQAIPDFFDIETAVSDQLTLLGKRLGWPREHPVFTSPAIIGFDCDDYENPLIRIVGACEPLSTYADCGAGGLGFITIDDDEIYRAFLKVRAYQIQQRFDRESIQQCLEILWGEQSMLLDSGNGRIVVAPGRDLTDAEKSVIQLYPRAIPAPLGIKTLFHLGPLPVAGYGEGWEGYCEPFAENGLPITVDGNTLVTENGTPIMTGPLTRGGEVMCEVDVDPYGNPLDL